jgi:hypothetical protein
MQRCSSRNLFPPRARPRPCDAVEKPCHTSDLHATILHLMGLDHEHLTYFHAGMDQRLTGVVGEVVG